MHPMRHTRPANSPRPPPISMPYSVSRPRRTAASSTPSGTQTVVTTKVVESGIVRAGEGRVEVLLLVDRPTTNKLQTTPVTYEDHVTVTMERRGDDWLIDKMST